MHGGPSTYLLSHFIHGGMLQHSDYNTTAWCFKYRFIVDERRQNWRGFSETVLVSRSVPKAIFGSKITLHCASWCTVGLHVHLAIMARQRTPGARPCRMTSAPIAVTWIKLAIGASTTDAEDSAVVQLHDFAISLISHHSLRGRLPYVCA